MRAARLPVGLAVAALLAGGGCSDSTGPDGAPGPEPLELDTGNLPPLPEFPDNPTTVQGVALGRRLFHETVLSGDGTQSCASCHLQTSAFADPDRFSDGIDGTLGPRNAQLIVNPAWQESFFWDGREPSLEEQAKDPVADPTEMGADWDDVVAALGAIPAYPPLFEAAFGTPEVTQDRVVRAIAQFERTFVSTGSRYDLWLRGELELTDAEKRGHDLFFSESGECFHCHGSLNLFTDDDFHDIGLDVDPPDPGLGGVNGNVFDRGKFKTPTLRNVEVSAPYMHDGRFDTLEEVLDHYAEGIRRSPNLDPVLGVHLNAGASGLPLTPQDRADVVAFLKALTDPAFLANPDLGPPSP